MAELGDPALQHAADGVQEQEQADVVGRNVDIAECDKGEDDAHESNHAAEDSAHCETQPQHHRIPGTCLIEKWRLQCQSGEAVGRAIDQGGEGLALRCGKGGNVLAKRHGMPTFLLEGARGPGQDRSGGNDNKKTCLHYECEIETRTDVDTCRNRDRECEKRERRRLAKACIESGIRACGAKRAAPAAQARAVLLASASAFARDERAATIVRSASTCLHQSACHAAIPRRATRTCFRRIGRALTLGLFAILKTY